MEEHTLLCERDNEGDRRTHREGEEDAMRQASQQEMSKWPARKKDSATSKQE